MNGFQANTNHAIGPEKVIPPCTSLPLPGLQNNTQHAVYRKSVAFVLQKAAIMRAIHRDSAIFKWPPETSAYDQTIHPASSN